MKSVPQGSNAVTRAGTVLPCFRSTQPCVQDVQSNKPAGPALGVEHDNNARRGHGQT